MLQGLRRTLYAMMSLEWFEDRSESKSQWALIKNLKHKYPSWCFQLGAASEQMGVIGVMEEHDRAMVPNSTNRPAANDCAIQKFSERIVIGSQVPQDIERIPYIMFGSFNTQVRRNYSFVCSLFW
jgi:hypothetical protein